jgi:tripartite-type tricarboxylate transporter receptor subunit TctC
MPKVVVCHRTLSGPTAAFLMMVSLTAGAQNWPARPVHIVIAYAAGGSTDVVGRVFAPYYQRYWGQPVIIDNRPGAGGQIGAEAVAKSAPDGLTLLMTSAGGQAAGPALYRKLNYDPVKDVVGVAPMGGAPNIFVINPSLPVANFNDFIALARKNPGKLNYGSTGVGSGPQLAFEMLNSAAKIEVVHIPYKGDGPLYPALISNEVQAAIISPQLALAQIKSGKIRALATSGTTRYSAVPDLPTIAELGFPSVEYVPWVGLFAPAATPREIINRINADTARIMQEPEIVNKYMPDWGLDPMAMPADAFHRRYLSEIETFKRVVREAKIPLID